MPETTVEKITFGVIMAILMVYGMEVYNAFWRAPWLDWHNLLIPLKEFIALILCVMFVQKFLGAALALRLKLRFGFVQKWGVPPGILMQICMVTVMCPLMSLVAALAFQMHEGYLLRNWWLTFLRNLPMAMLWQLLVAGPLTRISFRQAFRAS